MKSIKEKAEEFANKSPLMSKKGFEAGADYVIEQVEQLTNNQNWCAFPKQSHKELKELITKLKEK